MFIFLKRYKNKQVKNKIIRTFNCKATIEIPNENVIFEYNYGDYSKYRNGIEVMKATGSCGCGISYEDFINDVIHQYPLNETNKMIINMIRI